MRTGWILLACSMLALAGCFGDKPQPKPQPPEPPQNAVSVVAIYDAKAIDDKAVYTDNQVDAYCEQHGYQLRSHDVATVDETGKTPAYLAVYIAAAKGKTLPVICVGRGGKVLRVLEKPTDAQAVIKFIDGNLGDDGEASDAFWAAGHWRKLGGLKPARPGAAQRLGIAEEGQTKAEPIIPRAEWRDTSLLPYRFRTHDQNGYSSCCPTSGVGLMEIFGNRAGLKVEPLSALDAYARINGGRDAGAMLEDFLTAAMLQGVCSTAYCADQGWRKPQRKDGYELDRARHRILVATWCSTTDAMGSALMRRKPVQFGIMVTSQFSPDKSGVIGPKRSRGGGGHAVIAAGLRMVKGEVYYEMVNSWGTNWGGSADGTIPKGCCLLHESWAEPAFGAWALASIVSPSDDKIAEAVGGRSPRAASETSLALAP